MKNLEEINRQSVVTISGAVQETKAKDFDFELKAEKIVMLAKAVHPSTN